MIGTGILFIHYDQIITTTVSDDNGMLYFTAIKDESVESDIKEPNKEFTATDPVNSLGKSAKHYHCFAGL